MRSGKGEDDGASLRDPREQRKNSVERIREIDMDKQLRKVGYVLLLVFVMIGTGASLLFFHQQLILWSFIGLLIELVCLIGIALVLRL